MKYNFVIFVLIGFTIFVHGAYAELDRSILEPFGNSDIVIVGTVVQVTVTSENKTQYDFKVDEYLKGNRPFDLITATLDSTIPADFPKDPIDYFNKPYFEKNNQVLAYLKQDGSGFQMSPYSFTIKKPTVVGPPIVIHSTGPQQHIMSQGEEIVISGNIKKSYLYTLENSGFNSNFDLVILNENNEQVDSKKLDINLDGSYSFTFQDKGELQIPGKYSWEIAYHNGNMAGEFIVKTDQKLWTVLKQFSSGISFDEIQCKDDLVLIQKYDDSPACVNRDTIPKLIQRGWIDVDPRLEADKKVPKFLCELYGGGFFDGTGECMDIGKQKCEMLGGVWGKKCIVPELAGMGIETEPDPNPTPEPEPESIPETEQLQRQMQLTALNKVQEILQTDYRGNEIKINAIKEYVDKFESDYFMKQFLFVLKDQYKKDDMINFTFTEWGYQNQECTSPVLKMYLKPYNNYAAFGSIEKIYEWQNPNYCDSLEPYSDGYLILNFWRMPDFPEQYRSCTVPGEYKIFAASLDGENPHSVGSFTCQREMLQEEPQPWMELPD